MVHHHFLLVALPVQGHINPTLQLAKRLTRAGAHVTFATSVTAHRRLSNTPTPDGLAFAPISDGYDDGFKLANDYQHFMSDPKFHASQALTDLILASLNGCRPVTCLIYNYVLPWAAEVADNLRIPSVLLWVQPASVFDIYYFYFNGYGDLIANNSNDPTISIDLPGLPLLSCGDLPSYCLLPSSTSTVVLASFQQLIQNLERKTKPQVLVNTFDALEAEALKAIDKFNLIGIGPLIPSAFLDGKDPSDTFFGGDQFLGSRDYIEWLNTKPESSVVYLSFGSMATISKQQIKEMTSGLLESRRPFLWVILPASVSGKEDEIQNDVGQLNQEGMIVPWCSQVEVLCHPSVGCFVTHCGWNSTLESLVGGVPVVTFPQKSDQATNAKLVKDVWGTGVKLGLNEEGIVEGNELKRCLEMVMEGERGEELRRNAQKWKDLAKEAVMDGGSSDRNLRAIVDDVGWLENLVSSVERMVVSASDEM